MNAAGSIGENPIRSTGMRRAKQPLLACNGLRPGRVTNLREARALSFDPLERLGVSPRWRAGGSVIMRLEDGQGPRSKVGGTDTLPTLRDEETARRTIRRNRALATSLLATMTMLFIATWLVPDPGFGT